MEIFRKFRNTTWGVGGILIYPELTLLVLNFKLDTSVIKKKKNMPSMVLYSILAEIIRPTM